MSHPALRELEVLLPRLYGPDEADQRRAAGRRDELFAELTSFMATSDAAPANPMKFGTSGWRGLLASDFTVANVACVTQALAETVLDPALHRALGVSSTDDLLRRGCVLAHDTRIMGPTFVETAARVLLAHGIPVIVLGITTTPEVSAAIAE